MKRSKYLQTQITATMLKKATHGQFNTRDKVLFCFALMDQDKFIPEYMREVVEVLAVRVEKYKNNPHVLDFGHNERVMIDRLYTRLASQGVKVMVERVSK